MIGVIGGNGVAATNRLATLIEEQLVKDGAFRDAHHPEMIFWQATQVPSRSMYLEGRGPSFIDDYVSIGERLKECGCDTLCMCCNTAHYAVEELSGKIGLPFINIIDEVAKVVNEKGYKHAIIMCSDGCRMTALYEKSFAKYAPNTSIIYPSEKEQILVTKGICNAKNILRYNNENLENPNIIFSKLVNLFIERYKDLDGVCIIGGCTDINNVYDGKGIFNYVDSLQILAKAIIERWKY